MVKETLSSLQRKITKVANDKKLSPSVAEKKLINLYKKRAKLITDRRR